MTKPHDAALFPVFVFLCVFKHQPQDKSEKKEKARIKQINAPRTGTDGHCTASIILNLLS